MSEYIATAKVKVEPDTKGFERILREKLKPILAKPFGVTVVPVTKGFVTAINKAVGTKPVPVPILPAGIKSFSKAITDAAVAAKVGAVPDIKIAAFKAALQAQVDVAAAGVTAKVPATPVGTVGGGAAAAETAALQKSINTLTNEMRLLLASMSAVQKGSKGLGGASKALTVEEKLQEKATEQLAAAQLELAAAQSMTLGVEQRASAIALANTKIKAAASAASDLVAKSATAENIALRNTIRTTEADVIATQQGVAALQERITTEKVHQGLLKRKLQIESEVNALLATEIRTVSDLNVAETLHARATELTTQLKALEAAARRGNATAIASELAALRASTAGFTKLAKDRVKASNDQIKASRAAVIQAEKEGKTATGQIRFFRRGVAATALSLLGIRGATLAATGAFLGGAAAATIFALSVREAASLETELNVFAETAGATAEQMDHVRQVAEELGRDIRLPGISASEATVAMTNLAKAGLSVEDSIKGATGVLQLSIAANLDLARSTEIVASALNAFGLSGEEAIRVADVLANSANLAQGTIDVMGIAMQQASAVGRQAGLTFEDTATFLTVLARAGLRGSDAGTSLRTGLIRLINPTEKAQKILDKLGVSIRDAQGNIRPEIFQNLAAATAGMSKAQRDQTIAQLAGNDAVRAFSIIMRLTTPELIKARVENRKLGSAQRLTEARAKGLAGATRGLASNLQTTGLTIGRTATPALQSLVVNMNAAVLAISESETVARGLTASIDLLSASWDTLATALGSIAPIALQAAGGLSKIALSIGLGEILAAAAAYRIIPALLIFKLLPAASATSKAFVGLRTAIATTAASIAIGGTFSTGLLGIRAGLAAATTGLIAFASTVQGVALIAAIAAGGLFYLLTRETELEKVQKRLKESTDALSQSLSSFATSSQAASDALSAIQTERLGLQTATLNKELAAFTLRNSDAAKGSLERRQLENALAVAIDNQRLAQERFNESLKRSKEAQEEQAIASKNIRRARNDEIQSLSELIGKGHDWAKLIVEQHPERVEEAYATAIRVTNGELEKRIRTLEEENTVASRDLAKRLGAIQELQNQLGRLLEPKEIRILLNADSVNQGLRNLAKEFGIQGKASIDLWAKTILDGLKPFTDQILVGLQPTFDSVIAAFETVGRNANQAFQHGFGTGAPLGPAVPNTFEQGGGDVTRLTAQQVLGRIAGLERQRRRARIAGASSEDEGAFLREEESLIRQRISAGKLSVVQRAKLEQELERIIGEQEQIANDITSAEEDAAQKAEDQAQKAQDARDKRDAAFLALLARREQKVLNAQAKAALSEGIRDDIVVNRNLKRLYKQQIEKIKDRVKDKETRNEAIRDLQKRIFQLDLDFVQLQKQAAEEAQQRIRESLELDIEFFSTTENVPREIAARKRLIRHLKKLQADEKKGTTEYKRLRNLIAEQEQAIKDLKEQTVDRNNAFAELTFEFLQAQQGFAANLFGNLLPMGSTAGLVGNVSPTGGGGGAGGGGAAGTSGVNLPHGAAVGGGPQGPWTVDRGLTRAGAAASSRRGSAAARANTEIEVLRQILLVLSKIEQRDGHPESRRSKIHLSTRSEGLPHGV